MKYFFLVFCIFLIIFLSGCQPQAPYCTENSLAYLEPGETFPTLEEISAKDTGPKQIIVEVNGKEMSFDQVVHGPLCNNHLNGKVYIACDIQIAKWQEKPTFLDGCDFEISPGSVVYVAAHNNAPYFQGCDFCHLTGKGLTP